MLLNRILRWAVLTLVVTNANALQAETQVEERVIYGWIEWVSLDSSNMVAKAKLDTGAKTSSLHAKNIEWFEKDGKDWVRFQFSPNTKLSSKRMLEGKTKNFVTIEAPVYRSTLIKQHKRASAERPVIHQTVRLDGREYEVEFTLTDRSRFIYPVLLGRRFLEKVAIVDPGTTFLRTRQLTPEVAEESNQETGKVEETSKDKEATSVPDQPAKPDEKEANSTSNNKNLPIQAAAKSE